MKRTGQQSNVLNVDPRAPASAAYIKVSSGWSLGRELIRHAFDDWTLSVHTNGHNAKSWAISLASALAAQFGPGARLTLHSGFAPAYIRSASASMRVLMRLTCLLCDRVVCVNEEISSAVSDLGIPTNQVEITPAFLPIDAPDVEVPAAIHAWMDKHAPVITSAMFFRPEYGFELLVPAIARLKKRYPRIGCLVMGGDDRSEAQAFVIKHGLDDAVHIAGDLDHELCLALMARSNMFARPTLRDGDSISIREALALGVPVVASNVGTRPDGVVLFEAGNVGELVKAMDRVLSGAEAELGQRKKLALAPAVGAVYDRAFFTNLKE
jgi:glycogen(starch) synthase